MNPVLTEQSAQPRRRGGQGLCRAARTAHGGLRVTADYFIYSKREQDVAPHPAPLAGAAGTVRRGKRGSRQDPPVSSGQPGPGRIGEPHLSFGVTLGPPENHRRATGGAVRDGLDRSPETPPLGKPRTATSRDGSGAEGRGVNHKSGLWRGFGGYLGGFEKKPQQQRSRRGSTSPAGGDGDALGIYFPSPRAATRDSQPPFTPSPPNPPPSGGSQQGRTGTRSDPIARPRRSEPEPALSRLPGSSRKNSPPLWARVESVKSLGGRKIGIFFHLCRPGTETCQEKGRNRQPRVGHQLRPQPRDLANGNTNISRHIPIFQAPCVKISHQNNKISLKVFLKIGC